MLRLEELESRIVSSVCKVIRDGFLLIKGAEGVIWDYDLNRWKADPKFPFPACDVLGAVLLTSDLGSLDHHGQYERAIRLIIEPDFYYALDSLNPDLDTLLDSEVYRLSQSLLNGWDGSDCIGGHEPAYSLGKKLAKVYMPLSVDLLELELPSANETRIPRDLL